ncbi:MAG: SLBB domain-containing protein [Thiolinea sp.]
MRQPGVFPVTGSLSVLQAIALAGGLTEQADTRHAVLLRRDATGQISQQPIDIAAIRQGRIQDFPLVQDDRLVVQEGTLSRFTVTGAVASPGVFPLKEGMSLMQAIATAGGMTRLADKSHAVLFRRTAEGRVQRYGVDLEAIYSGSKPDPFLQQDDRIVLLDSRNRLLFEDATRLVAPVTLF